MFKRGDIANNLFLICFTHMECILCGWGRIGYSDVSIHALTRGATGAVGHYGFHKEVSIHASTRGATNSQILFTMSLVFQSTHPHGVRQYIFQSADFLTYTLIFLRTFHGIKLKSNRLTKKRCNWFIISECDWYTIYVPL